EGGRRAHEAVSADLGRLGRRPGRRGDPGGAPQLRADGRSTSYSSLVCASGSTRRAVLTVRVGSMPRERSSARSLILMRNWMSFGDFAGVAGTIAVSVDSSSCLFRPIVASRTT